jgi:hypothetical protein
MYFHAVMLVRYVMSLIKATYLLTYLHDLIACCGIDVHQTTVVNQLRTIDDESKTMNDTPNVQFPEMIKSGQKFGQCNLVQFF